VRVVGFASGRPKIDGRPGDPPHRIAAMTYNFRPGTVPIITSHQDGALLGYLDHLESVEGRDLVFTADVDADAVLIGRLRFGVAISIEAGEVGPAHPSTVAAGQAWAASKPHFRGVWREGWNLIGIALSDNPAAPGSGLWLAS
jgi:hypothetical protein